MKDEKPEISLLQTIESPNLINLSSDFAELSLDQMLDQGLLHDIPFFGTIVKLGKFGIDARNYLFLKKIYAFLGHLKGIPEKKRKKFIEELKSEAPFRKRTGENLLLLLEKLNDMSKPDMLGRAFKSYIEKDIDFMTLNRLSTAIEKINVYDIPFLISYYKGPNKIDNSIEEPRQDLANCGLLTLFPSGSLGGGGFFYSRNKLGETFIKTALAEEL